MIRFEDLDEQSLWNLRNQISLTSIYYADYRNDFGFDEHSVCDFFDGYADYLSELMEEDGHTDSDFYRILDQYDNSCNLYEWYCCCEDWSWIKYDKESFFFDVIAEIEDDDARWYAQHRKECFFDEDDISEYATEQDKEIILKQFWTWYKEFMADFDAA